MEQHVLKSYTANGGTAYPSIRYNFDGFMQSLQIMANDGFGADFKFMLWDRDRDKFRLGLVNVAAFLAQATVEAIHEDTCDELNWQQVAGRYAISNSCGQEGRSYQHETCGMYSCIMDPNMEVTSVSSANQVRAPPPMECRPGSGTNFYAGYWDTSTGTEIKNTPYSNTAGRIDIEGCCYWGRGVLLTRGSCNIGKLNYYLGARAAREGRQSLYPDIDFCTDPEATCQSSVTEELRWTTAMFEWSERVQRYDNTGWAYEDELTKFFDEGMADDSFIDAVSRIFSRGCHTAGCSDIEVRMADQRKSNFFLIINDILGIDGIELPTNRPTRRHSPAPTPRPLNCTPQPTNVLNTPKPTPRPTNPTTPLNLTPQPTDQLTIPTKLPTPEPMQQTPIPIQQTPQPSPRPLGITVPIGLSPQAPLQPAPTYPPLKSDPFPTVPYPTTIATTEPRPTLFANPRPIGQPSNDSNGQTFKSEEPTYSEALIPLEGNGAERSALFQCSYTIFGLSAIHLLLALV